MNKFAFIKEKWDWKPHLSQKEFMAFDSKIKIAACGRRWGKTEASAYDMAYYFLTEENYSQMIVSPTYDQSKLIFRTLESLLKDMKNIEIKRSPYSYMKLKNNIITARTADNDGLGCSKLVVFCNAVEDNPFMAGAFHGVGEAERVINVGVSGPGVVHHALQGI